MNRDIPGELDLVWREALEIGCSGHAGGGAQAREDPALLQHPQPGDGVQGGRFERQRHDEVALLALGPAAELHELDGRGEDGLVIPVQAFQRVGSRAGSGAGNRPGAEGREELDPPVRVDDPPDDQALPGRGRFRGLRLGKGGFTGTHGEEAAGGTPEIQDALVDIVADPVGRAVAHDVLGGRWGFQQACRGVIAPHADAPPGIGVAWVGVGGTAAGAVVTPHVVARLVGEDLGEVAPILVARLVPPDGGAVLERAGRVRGNPADAGHAR